MEQLEVILENFEFDVDFIERELVEVSITSIDIIHKEGETGATALADLTDVNLSTLLDEQYLQYNSTTGKWENANLGQILLDKSVFSESPTQISTTIFQTVNNYVSGSIRVFLNGLKENNLTETANNQFTFDTPIVVGDVIEVNYIKQ